MENDVKQRKTFKEFAEEDWAARKKAVPYAMGMGIAGMAAGGTMGAMYGEKIYKGVRPVINKIKPLRRGIDSAIAKYKKEIKDVLNSEATQGKYKKMFPDESPIDVASVTYGVLTNKKYIAGLAGVVAGQEIGSEAGEHIGGYKGLTRYEKSNDRTPSTRGQYALRKAVGAITGTIGSAAAGYTGGAIAKKLNAKNGYVWVARAIPAMLANEPSRMAGEYTVANNTYKKTLDT